MPYQRYTSLPFTHFKTGDLVYRGTKPDVISWLALNFGATGNTNVIVATENSPFVTTLENINYWSK